MVINDLVARDFSTRQARRKSAANFGAAVCYTFSENLTEIPPRTERDRMPRRTFTTLLLMAIVLLCLLVVRKAELLRSREKVLTADEAYEALHAEYTAAAENLQQTAAAARSDRERQYVSQTLFPELNARFAGRYLDIVRKYPQDPRGIEATLWLCTRPDWGKEPFPPRTRLSSY